MADQDSSPGAELPRYVIEGARSGRSRCRTCRRKIAQGQIRLGILLEGPYGTGYLWHHLKCAARSHFEALEEAYRAEAWREAKEEPSSLPPLEELRELSLQAEKRKRERKEIPYLELAPSGRAACKLCGMKIAKGTLRFVLGRRVEFGNQVRIAPMTVHPGCVTATLELPDCDTAAEDFQDRVRANSADLETALIERGLGLVEKGEGPVGGGPDLDRMTAQFMAMVRIDSESGEEQAMMDYLLKAVPQAGGRAELDDYGNLLARFPARACRTDRPILLSCHADTVKPGRGIEPVLADGVIRSAGPTILGADDKAGIAEVLEAMRCCSRRPAVEFAVSRQEEVGLLGVKAMDLSRLDSRWGFLLDNDELETIVVGGPSYFALDAEITGRGAHAGMEPEKGISAILAAARAISALPLGRLDPETTANVGVIEGGTIRNGVPEKARFLAECRSSRHERAAELAREMGEIMHREVESLGATLTLQVDNLCRAVDIPPDSLPVRIAREGLARVGIEAEPVRITGFTDASIYNNAGIQVAVVGMGARAEHSTAESIALADMEKACRALVEMLDLAAAELEGGEE